MFSIITVCFNSKKTIERTLDSILRQTYKDYEYLIIDGGSTDGTLEIIERYASLFYGRMRYISESDEGIYDAMNKGIKMAKGEIIGIVNSDDYYETDTLETVKREYERLDTNSKKYAVMYGYQRNLSDGKEKTIEFHHHQFLDEIMINHPTCFVTASTYSKYGCFDTNFKSAADLDLMLRFDRTGVVNFIPIYSILSNFELGGMSSSAKGAREVAKIRYRYGNYSRIRYLYVCIQSTFIGIVHKIRRLGR